MTSVKSNEVLFKLHQDTGKAKIFAVQMKSKLRERERERERELELDLIRRWHELDEAETLNAVAKAKDKLKVAQMLDTLVEDTASKHNLSLKSE